ncbi:MAG: ABC transporter permease [Clostridia bacterium]
MKLNKSGNTSIKEPLIRVAKRDKLKWWQNILFYVGAILIALIVGGIFISAIGQNPFSYYAQVIAGNFTNNIYIKHYLEIIVPLLITSLGVSVAFKMKFWNIGGEGQFIMGAIMAATLATVIGDTLPSWLTIIIVLLFGIIGGGLFGAMVAILKVKFNTNETLLTLMLNYVALYLLAYFKNVDFYKQLDVGAFLDFRKLPKNAWLPTIGSGIFTFDITIIFALIMVVLLFFYYNYTKHGYEINVIGDSPNTARYAGMNVKWIIIRTAFLSAGIIGLAGAFHVIGSSANHMLSENITGGVGWTGIIVAWLAKLNPFGILIATGLLGLLQNGSSVAESTMHISSSSADIIQGIILFTVLAMDFFVRFKVIIRKKNKNGENTVEVEENKVVSDNVVTSEISKEEVTE